MKGTNGENKSKLLLQYRGLLVKNKLREIIKEEEYIKEIKARRAIYNREFNIYIYNIQDIE